MNTGTPIVERALQIARSGLCAKTGDVKKALVREGYTAIDLMHITPTLSLQIKKLCSEAQAKRQGCARHNR